MERRTVLKAAAIAPAAVLIPQAAQAKHIELPQSRADLNHRLWNFYCEKDGVRAFINRLVKATTDAHHQRHPYVRSKNYNDFDNAILFYWLYGEAFWNAGGFVLPEEVRDTRKSMAFPIKFNDNQGQPVAGLIRRTLPYEVRGVSALHPYFFWLFSDPKYDMRPFEGGLAQEVVRTRGVLAAQLFEPHLKDLIR